MARNRFQIEVGDKLVQITKAATAYRLMDAQGTRFASVEEARMFISKLGIPNANVIEVLQETRHSFRFT